MRELLLKRGRDLGLIELDSRTFEVLRIEAGTPVFGKDITEKNLPQEIGRDDRAINFVKGCYLGQETVAPDRCAGSCQSDLTRAEVRAEFGLPCAGLGPDGWGQARWLDHIGRVFAAFWHDRGTGDSAN